MRGGNPSRLRLLSRHWGEASRRRRSRWM